MAVANSAPTGLPGAASAAIPGRTRPRLKPRASTPYSTNRPTLRMSGCRGGAACASLHHCCSRIETNRIETLELTNMKTHVTLFALAVATFSAFAADITGTWKAEFNTQRGLQKYTFTLKQDRTSVTGKANAERDG